MQINLKKDSHYDFRRCCLAAAFPAVVTTAMLVIQLCLPVVSKLATNASAYKLLFVDDTFISSLIYLLLLAAGMCTAFFQFDFLSNRSKSNNIMSLGLKRNQLFVNRLFTSIASLFLTVFTPLTVTFLVNIHYLGIKSYMLKTYALYVLSFFTVILIGFTVSVLSSALCGTVIESILLSISLLAFPYAIMHFIAMCCRFFLKGYCYAPVYGENSINSLYWLCPLNLTYSSGNYFDYLNHSSVWDDRGVIQAKAFSEIPEYAKAVTTFSSYDYLLFIAWLIICLFVLFLARRLFIKRKAEICGLYKSSKPASRILSSFAIIASVDISMLAAQELGIFGRLSLPEWLCPLILLTLITIIAYIVSAFVFNNSPRKPLALLLRSDPLLLMYIVPVCCIFGGFGFSSRVPSSDDIDTIKISFPYSVDASEAASFKILSGFETDSEKAIIADIHKRLINNNSFEGGSQSILIKYTLKNKGQIYREYKDVPADILLETTRLYDCKTVKDYIYSQIADKASWSSEELYPNFFRERIGFSFKPRDVDWLHFENIKVSLRPNNNFASTDITSNMTAESFEMLLDVLAKDLSNLSSKDFYTPDEPPIGAISITHMGKFVSLSFIYEGDSLIHNFYVYPSMKNTIDYLKFYGVYDALSKESEIIEIALFDCKYDDFFVQNSSKFEHNNALAINTRLKEDLYKSLKITDTVPYKSFTEKEDIALVKSKLFPYYLTVKQNLSFAKVKYADQNTAFFIIKNDDISH